METKTETKTWFYVNVFGRRAGGAVVKADDEHDAEVKAIEYWYGKDCPEALMNELLCEAEGPYNTEKEAENRIDCGNF